MVESDPNQGYDPNQNYYNPQQQVAQQPNPYAQNGQQPQTFDPNAAGQQTFDPNQQQQYYHHQQQYSGQFDPSFYQQQNNMGGDNSSFTGNEMMNNMNYMNNTGAAGAAGFAGATAGMGDPNQSVYCPSNDGNMELRVLDAQLLKSSMGDYHSYPIQGRDSLGDIECTRRFNNFFVLRNVLVVRYPGLYIPPIPNKQNPGGSKDSSIVRERQYFLDAFLKELSGLRYLSQSKEIQIFLRPQGDLEKQLQKLYRPQTQEILSTYRATLPVQEDYQDRDIQLFEADISQFISDQKAMNAHLVNFKKSLKEIIPIKQQEKMHYQKFANFLQGYETTRNNKSNEVGELAHVRLIKGEDNTLMDKLESMANQHQNPLVHIAHWVKSEVWCLEALSQAILEKASIEAKKKQSQSEIISLNEEILRLNANKFTIKSMFKNEMEKKQTAVRKTEVKKQLELDVVNYDVIKKYLTIYYATVAIPMYKKQRTEAYIRAMGRMADAEVRNAENIFDCWTNFQKTIQSYNIKY